MGNSFLSILGIKLKIFSLFLVLFLCLLSINSAYAISNKLNYQGRLLDKSGNAVSKTVSVKFSIYDSLTGGMTLWSETKDIVVVSGYFSTVLGDTTTLSLDFNSDDYYLGLKFGSDSEMSPRKYIGAAPFAVNASKLNGTFPGTSANNILKLGNSGNIDIAGEIKTTGALIVSGTTNLIGTVQLNGTAISASATELNYVDGVTSGIQNQIDNRLSLGGGTLSGNLVFSGSQTVDGIDISAIPTTYLALSGGTLSGAINMGDANITNIAQLALTPRSDGTTITGYVYYDTEDNTFYGRTNSSWVNFAGDGGDITSVTAGTGLTGGGLVGDVTLNVAAGDGTITVAADSIIVGTIGSANITDGAITAADLGADSVDASELSATAILFGDIEAGDLPAAIDATKIGAGATSNTEFGYLDGVTSALQTQLDAHLLLAGGTMVGAINMGSQNITNAGTLGIVETGVLPQYYTIFQGGDQAATITYTLPTAAPAVSGYVLSATTGGVMSWAAQTSSPWTDGGSYLYPSSYESLRIYDSDGSNYYGISSGDLGGIQVGSGATASGLYSIAIGSGVTASQSNSVAMGLATVASGTYSTASGTGSTASGSASVALGYITTASGAASVALGGSTIASGYSTTALGDNTTAQAYDSTVFGRYNVIAGSTGSWVATDPLFVIGNGSGSGSPANALTVLKNGNTTLAGNLLPGTDNTYDLGSAAAVYNDGYFTNVLAGTGDAMTITTNASSTWSTSDGTLTVRGDDGLTLSSLSGGILMSTVAGSDLNINQSGSSYTKITSASYTDITAFYLDASPAAGNLTNNGMYLYYKPDGTGADINVQAQRIFLEGSNITAADTYVGLAINVSAGSNAPDKFIELTNAQDAGTIGQAIDIWAVSGGDITDGILFNGISGSGNITDAIDASYANITNALNVGANIITGTLASIDFTNFDVSGAGALTLGGKITNTNYAGSSSIDNGSLSKTVNTVYISTSDKIFISFTTNPGGYWWVGSIVNATSFDVNTSAVCGQLGGCTFDYWIVK